MNTVSLTEHCAALIAAKIFYLPKSAYEMSE